MCGENVCDISQRLCGQTLHFMACNKTFTRPLHSERRACW